MLNVIFSLVLRCITTTPVLITIFTLLAIYIYNRLTVGICTCTNRMDGKTVMIIGCSSGIGKEAAKDIAKRGARLIIAEHVESVALKFKDELIKESKNENIVYRKVDLTSLTSVREFAKVINREEKRLDVLIHNAGIGQFAGLKTEDGLDLTMSTNYFGPFLLTHLLIDLLKKSKPSRIIFVASIGYLLGYIHPSKVTDKKAVVRFATPYFASKYALIMFTIELARRLEGTGVTANCLHPGILNTDIWNNVKQPLKFILKSSLQILTKSVKEGAQTTIHLAVSDEVKNVTGKFFADCQETRLFLALTSPTRANKLWEVSESAVKLQPTDPKI